MRWLILALIFLVFEFGPAFSQDLPPEYARFVYQDEGRRDIFVPLVDKDGRYLLETEKRYSFSELNLSGILWDPQGNSSALINNQIVMEGETICGFTVKEITRSKVTLFKDDKEYFLKSFDETER